MRWRNAYFTWSFHYFRYNASTTSTLASPYGLYYGNKNDFSIQDEYEILTNFELGKKWKFVKDQLILANSTGGEKFFINYLSASSVPTGEDDSLMKFMRFKLIL